MDTDAPSLDDVLSNYPIVQAVHGIIVAFALPPVVLLLIHLSKIALHDNCKFLLHTWASAFLLSICSHGAFIACDLISGKYIVERNDDPPIRLLIFSVHGFAHAMSSAQELILSIERVVSCASPALYHSRRLSKGALLGAETFAAVVSLMFLWQISKGNILVGCYIVNTIDLASLFCLSVTTHVVQKKQSTLQSTLNGKYQIREAIAVTRVMLPCGAISLVMKALATLGPWVYATGILESKYMFTISSAAYLIIESLNCAICCIVVLTGHAGIRTATKRMFWEPRATVTSTVQSAEDARRLHFEALRRQWE